MPDRDDDSIPQDLPGRELVIAGLSDLRCGRETVEAMLVASASTRLREAGVDVPRPVRRDADERMYQLLDAQDPAAAYNTYNVLRRRLVSFCETLEHHRRAR